MTCASKTKAAPLANKRLQKTREMRNEKTEKRYMPQMNQIEMLDRERALCTVEKTSLYN